MSREPVDGARAALVVGAGPGLGGAARGFETDARSEDQVVDLLDRVESELGELEVVVFNPGANSVRGGSGYAAFASAKAGLRSAAERVDLRARPAPLGGRW